MQYLLQKRQKAFFSVMRDLRMKELFYILLLQLNHMDQEGSGMQLSAISQSVSIL